jgi:L-alanine-DL-glutamate epimerase-like enolase superfamily enzyme
MAEAFNVQISNGGGAPFQNRHLQAGVSNGTSLEWQFNAVLACSAIYKDLPAQNDGWMKMPQDPGLGLVADRAAIDRLVDRRSA